MGASWQRPQKKSQSRNALVLYFCWQGSWLVLNLPCQSGVLLRMVWEWGWESLTLLYQALPHKRGDFIYFILFFFCDFWVINASEILIGFNLFPLFKRNCMRELYVAMRDSCFLLHQLEELGKGSNCFSSHWLQEMRMFL